MQRIRLGREPDHIDNKWVVSYQEPWLCFHRFLTGNCIYKVQIVYEGLNWRICSVLVNGDSNQYKFENETTESKLFHKLFDLFLESRI